MNNKLKNIEINELLNILEKEDDKDFFVKTNKIPDSESLYKKFEKYINPDKISNKAVLGIDIYKYGSFDTFRQSLIPFLFRLLYNETISLCLTANQFIFQKHKKEDFEKAFIDTGDGGFQIFETPLHALVFNVMFESVLRTYNSFHLYPRLRNIIGPISLRYAMTYDKIYAFNNNYYGSAIINNTRILSKDTLDRCLVDTGTYNWFLLSVNGFENLQIITLNEISSIYEFSEYNKKYIKNGVNVTFTNEYSREIGIVNSDILKIGRIQSKESELSIYNLHLQVILHIGDENDINNKKIFTISLGNLNTTGI